MNKTSGLDQAMVDVASGMAGYIRKAAATQGATDKTDAAAGAYSSGQGSVRPLQGDTIPQIILKKEEPIHILMCYMLAAGRTQKEIAEQTGYSKAAVGLICRQPAFRSRFLALAKESGQDAIDAFFRGEVAQSAVVLTEIRDDPATSAANKIAAVNSILDRAMGKPTVNVKSETALNLTSATASKEDLERQLAATYAEQESRGIRATRDTRN